MAGKEHVSSLITEFCFILNDPVQGKSLNLLFVKNEGRTLAEILFAFNYAKRNFHEEKHTKFLLKLMF